MTHDEDRRDRAEALRFYAGMALSGEMATQRDAGFRNVPERLRDLAERIFDFAEAMVDEERRRPEVVDAGLPFPEEAERLLRDAATQGWENGEGEDISDQCAAALRWISSKGGIK